MERSERPRRPRKTKREKLEEELIKTEEAIEQYEAAIATMQERHQALAEEIEQEQIREVTRLLKEKNLSVEQLKGLLGDRNMLEELGQGTKSPVLT